MGLRPGWPDVQIVADGRYHGIEVKSGDGRLSPVQIATHRAIADAGGLVATVHNIDDAVAALMAWRLPLRIIGARMR